MSDQDQKQQIRDFMTDLGLTYSAVFRPVLQPEDTVPNPVLHWIVTLTIGKASMQADYTEGMGHIEGYQAFHKTKYDKRVAMKCYRHTCETGKLYRPLSVGLYWRSIIGTQPAPDVLDVLYCLATDSESLQYTSYESWAAEFGYNEDSRKGEQAYIKCVQQSVRFGSLLGFPNLEKLRLLYYNY